MEGVKIPELSEFTAALSHDSDIDLNLDLGFDFQDVNFIQSALIDDNMIDPCCSDDSDSLSPSEGDIASTSRSSSDDADDYTIDFSVACNGTSGIPTSLSQLNNQPQLGKPLKRLYRKKKVEPKKSSSTRTANALGGLVCKVPNISRRKSHSGLKLYAFPSFDKCDSLIYLPSSMARYINSSDIKSLNHLLHTHMDDNCRVSFGPLGEVMPGPSMILAMFQAMMEYYPDSLMVARTDKVEGSCITASASFKYTDCQELVDLMRKTTSLKWNPFTALHHQPRRDRLLMKLTPKERSVEELQALTGLFDNTQEDLIIHGSGSIKINFDNFTRKITSFDLGCFVVSVETRSSLTTSSGTHTILRC